MQLFHYWKMTWELKLVLCIQPISIRGIVAAAQFKIIQCMLTNGIGISDLTVGWIISKENILIHEELPGKLENATFTLRSFSSLHWCWCKFSTCWGVPQNVGPFLPLSYFVEGWIRFPHTWLENTPSKIYFMRTKEVQLWFRTEISTPVDVIE